jgi:hypothetical protein
MLPSSSGFVPTLISDLNRFLSVYGVCSQKLKMLLNVTHVVVKKCAHARFHSRESGLYSIHVAVRTLKEIENGLKPTSTFPSDNYKAENKGYVSGYRYGSFQRHRTEKIGHSRLPKKGASRSPPHSTDLSD